MIVSVVLGNSATGLLSVSQKFSTVYSNMYTMFHMSWSESASLHIAEGSFSARSNKFNAQVICEYSYWLNFDNAVYLPYFN